MPESTKKTTKFYKSKAVWTGIAAIVTTVGAYMSGQMELETAIQTGFGSLMAIFLRTGMMK